MTKIEKIKQSLQQTREKRKSQICKVYELKFDKSKLSKEKLNFLNMLFVEAKWLYNYQLASNNIFEFSDKIKEVEVLNKDKQIEKKELKYLSSQMKQSLIKRIKQNIINLSKSKKKGNIIGRLKFKSRINSIPLKQFKHTYDIINNKTIRLQGFKKHFKILGFNQTPINTEFANATLVRKCNNYYLKITCFLPKKEKVKTYKNIGLDFGIKDNIVDSKGNKYNFQFLETDKLKKASRKLQKAKLGSNNRYKLKNKLAKEYEKIFNKKKDAKNKFISKLVNENDVICIQDEQIHNWAKSKMKGFGRRIQFGIMGGIIFDLKKKSETVVIDKFFPSTKLCPSCGALNKHNLEERIYNCECGYSQDRDIHSAKNILNQGLKQISMEYRNTMLVEKMSDLKETFVSDKQFSMKQEAEISVIH
jgi:transposase